MVTAIGKPHLLQLVFWKYMKDRVFLVLTTSIQMVKARTTEAAVFTVSKTTVRIVVRNNNICSSMILQQNGGYFEGLRTEKYMFTDHQNEPTLC